MKEFILEHWFELDSRISLAEIELAEAQIRIYAVKDGEDPNGQETKQVIRQMKVEVRKHNNRFQRLQKETMDG